jgi:hypothetical protein
MGPPPDIALVTMPSEVYDKLDLTTDEQTKVDAIRKNLHKQIRTLAPRPEPGSAPPSKDVMEANHAKIKKLQDAAETEALAALSADHKAMVTTLIKHMKTLQAVRLPAGAVLNLKLNDDQYTKLDALAPAKGVKGDPRQLRQKVEAILTADQKETLQEYMDAHSPMGGPGGGPGGPGGPDGGPGGPGGPDIGPGGPPPDGGGDDGGGAPPPPPDAN